MEKEHREIRALLSSMAPARAAQAVRLVGLPPDEEMAEFCAELTQAFLFDKDGPGPKEKLAAYYHGIVEPEK